MGKIIQIEDGQQLLDDLGLNQVPVNLIAVCDSLDIVYQEKPYCGFEGTLLVDNNKQLIGINSKIQDENRKRFTCAHELGHYYYDVPGEVNNFLIQCSKDDTGYGKQEIANMEIRANKFASELLMPKNHFLPDIRNKQLSWDLIQLLAKKYTASLYAVATRFVTLTHHSCWLVVAKEGKVQRFISNEANEFRIDVSKRCGKVAASSWIVTSADSWLYSNYHTKDKHIMCWPLGENQYGENLIILWDQYNSLLRDDISEKNVRDSYGSGQWNWE